MKRQLCPWIVLAALAGCAQQTDRPAAPTADNSRNAPDWPGTYVGTLPCADCEGIRMRIALRADGTFTRSLTYLGSATQPSSDTGTFAWDASGAQIELAANDAQRYQVGENALIHLDRNGQRIAGDDAAAYRLAKIVADPRLENRRWQLVELNGRPVDATADRPAAFFELDGAQSRITGNASCNRFFGNYDLTAGNRLQFAPDIGATLMACAELERERQFLEMLAHVDNYSTGDGMLSLNRARIAPLARFRASE